VERVEEGEGVGEGVGSSLLLRLRSSEGVVLDRGIVQWVHKVRRRINNMIEWHEFCYKAFMKLFLLLLFVSLSVKCRTFPLNSFRGVFDTQILKCLSL
jgi:hypothetical protein